MEFKDEVHMDVCAFDQPGFQAASDKRAWRGWGNAHFRPTRPLCAIEPAELPDAKKTSAEEKDYDSGFGRVTFSHTRTLLP
jgi:hypothetical protein